MAPLDLKPSNAAIRGAQPRLPVGSSVWIDQERDSVQKMVQEECTEFSFAASTQVDWLNEWMDGIFTKNSFTISDAFKTPKQPNTVVRRPLEPVSLNAKPRLTSPTKSTAAKGKEPETKEASSSVVLETPEARPKSPSKPVTSNNAPEIIAKPKSPVKPAVEVQAVKPRSPVKLKSPAKPFVLDSPAINFKSPSKLVALEAPETRVKSPSRPVETKAPESVPESVPEFPTSRVDFEASALESKSPSRLVAQDAEEVQLESPSRSVISEAAVAPEAPEASQPQHDAHENSATEGRTQIRTSTQRLQERINMLGSWKNPNPPAVADSGYYGSQDLDVTMELNPSFEDRHYKLPQTLLNASVDEKPLPPSPPKALLEKTTTAVASSVTEDVEMSGTESLPQKPMAAAPIYVKKAQATDVEDLTQNSIKETAVPAPNEAQPSLMSKVPPKKPVANTTATQLPSKLQQPVTTEVFSQKSTTSFTAQVPVQAKPPPIRAVQAPTRININKGYNGAQSGDVATAAAAALERSVSASSNSSSDSSPRSQALTASTHSQATSVHSRSISSASNRAPIAKPKALTAAARRREQEEKDKKRRQELKAETERHRAALKQEQEERKKQEAEAEARRQQEEKEKLRKKVRAAEARQQAAARKAQEDRERKLEAQAESQRQKEAARRAREEEQRKLEADAEKQRLREALRREQDEQMKSTVSEKEKLRRIEIEKAKLRRPPPPAARPLRMQPLQQDVDKVLPKRPLQNETAEAHRLEPKRVRTDDPDDTDVVMTEHVPKPMAQPVRMALSKSVHSVEAAQTKPTYTAEAMTSKPTHPMELAQMSKAPILFASNPGQSSQHNTKTPSRPNKSATSGKSNAKSVKKSPPAYLPGDEIELPDVFDSDDSDCEGFETRSWAEGTPMREQLVRQQHVDPFTIFGPPQPFNLEEVFPHDRSRFHSFRNRTSSANWDRDGLTVEEIEADRVGRERIARDGGWRYYSPS